MAGAASRARRPHLNAGKCRLICPRLVQMTDTRVPNRIVDNEDVGKGPCLAAVSRACFCEIGIPGVAAGRRWPTLFPSGRFPELPGEFQALALIVRADPISIDPFRPLCHAFVPQMRNQLPVLKQKRHIVGPDFQHAA